MDGAQVVDLPRGPGRPGGQKKAGGHLDLDGALILRTLAAFLRPALPAAKRRVKELLASKDEEIALKTDTYHSKSYAQWIPNKRIRIAPRMPSDRRW